MNPQTAIVTRSSAKNKRKSYPTPLRHATANKIINKIWNYPKAHEQTGAAIGSIERWVKQEINGEFMHVEAGRPSHVSREEMKSIVSEVKLRSKGPVQVGKRKFGTMLQNGANNTSIAQNKPIKHLSTRYINTKEKENCIVESNAEVIDQAHLTALLDPRHSLSFAAMHHYLRTKVSSGFFVTFDKTRFDLLTNDQATAKSLRVGKRPKTVKTPAPNNKLTHSNCSVQLYMVVSDGGKLADLVYLVKHNAMPLDSIDVHRAPILDISNSPGSTAYLMFLGDSSPNQDKSLEWLIFNIVLPFIGDLRASVANGSEKTVNLQIDGDPRQLQVMAEVRVQQALRFRDIIVTKSAASCTPTQAPLDEGNTFLTPKSHFRKLVRDGYVPTQLQEVEDLKELIREHLRKYPTKRTSKSKPSMEFGTYFSAVVKCLYTAAAALRKSAVPALVRDAFETTGVAPFNPTTIRNKCQYDFSPAEKDNFMAAVPALAKLFESNFELQEKDFEDAGIPSNNDPKDKLAVHRRRCLLLYAPHVLSDLDKQANTTTKK